VLPDLERDAEMTLSTAEEGLEFVPARELGDAKSLGSGIMATSSGTASAVLISYASVPGTSPWEGSSSTFSTRVRGIGEVPPEFLSRPD